MRYLNWFLLAGFLTSIVLNLAIRYNPSKPNWEILPEMVHTVRYNAYSPNPNFPDGKTLQQPPAGTIPRSVHLIHFLATPEGAATAGKELQEPFSSKDAAAVDRGAFVFRTFCQPCHGISAKGDGPVTLRGFPPPPSLLAAKALNLKDGQIFHILTYGQKNMPSYASQISQADRWKVILYVRSLQRSAKPVPTVSQMGKP